MAHPLAARFWRAVGFLRPADRLRQARHGPVGPRRRRLHPREHRRRRPRRPGRHRPRAPVVFGVSEGGAAATMFAATHADRVSAMVQFGTYARISKAPGLPRRPRPRPDPELLGPCGGALGRGEHRRLVGSEHGRRCRAGGLVGTDDAVGPQPWRSIGPSPRCMNRSTSGRCSPPIRVPTLVMYREDDKMVPAALSQAVARGIPGARDVELPGSDHLIFVGDQDAVLDEIEQFVTGGLASVPADRVLATDPVHRHRRLDRPCRDRGRPSMARRARAPRPDRQPRGRTPPRAHREVDR